MIESFHTDRREQCSSTAAHQSHSKSAAVSNKTASSLQGSFGFLYSAAKMPSTQQQGTEGSHQGHAVYWWRSSCDPHPGGTPVIDGLLLTNQWGILTEHQSEEDKCPGTGRRSTAGHYYRRVLTRCCLPVHLPRLHNHWQPLLGRRDRQEDWEGSFNSRASHGSSVEKPHSVGEDTYLWQSTMPMLPAHCCVVLWLWWCCNMLRVTR